MTLEAQFMDVNIPASACEHWAREEITRLRAELADMEARKDGAYLERNQCVALIARMAMALGHWAGLKQTRIEGWSEDWHGCVFIDLPAGQVSWHYHDSHAHLFDWLPPYCGEWDGHDTPEKYRRLLDTPTNQRAEKAEAALAELRAEELRNNNFYLEELAAIKAERDAAIARADKLQKVVDAALTLDNESEE